jgi:hypothetical protein
MAQIELTAFIDDFRCALTNPTLRDPIEAAWDDLGAAWEAADEAQRVQIEVFWQHYQPIAPTNLDEVRQLKKVCKIILNFVALAAPESLLDDTGTPLNV